MIALLALLACSGTPADDTGSVDTSYDTALVDSVAFGPGALALSFRMDADYIPTMAEDGQTPVGTFSGSIYPEGDATAVGPNDDAVSILDFSVPGIDLTPDGGPTGILLVTEEFDAQVVWVLGCLDVDVPADGCGDVGDPITVPNENKVQVIARTETPFEVYMGMLRP